MIVIVDYGMGNLASIKNMLKKIGVNSEITASPEKIEAAAKIILPGVGAFDNAMKNIEELGLYDILNQKVLVHKTPVLGICLGMQILMNKSEEGAKQGLGWIQGEVKRFDFRSMSSLLKVPHMGWNIVYPKDSNHLFKGLIRLPKFYFVHSYYVTCHAAEHVLATTSYGIEFASAVHKENIFGTQFHPEKSHKYGMLLLKNFVETT